MSEAKRAGDGPIKADLEEGETYAYCTCGESANQPFCDGSHKGTEFRPQIFKAEKSGPHFLCACKSTGNAPFCDGSHNK